MEFSYDMKAADGVQLQSVETAYGAYIILTGVPEFVARVNARKTVEVAVEFNGVVKAFTLREVLRLLSFDTEPSPDQTR